MGLNWGWVLLRLAIFALILAALFLSQRFWYRGAWRLTGRLQNRYLRWTLRGAYTAAIIAIIVATLDGMRVSQGYVIPRGSMITALAGLWFASALFAYLAVKAVRAFEWIWMQFRAQTYQPFLRTESTSPTVYTPLVTMPVREVVENPSRRYFFQTASVVAGAIPFVGALYGFAAERLHYVIHEVSVPVGNLPQALDGLRIAQLSDIHMSGYMTREQVRRAVDMANELGPDLAVVTGDFITSAGDSLGGCIAEIARLRAPLGTWGCNGNHEIYADSEALAQELFRNAGMRLLRQENFLLRWRGAQLNLIGVDYQRQRTSHGHAAPMLRNIEPLVRRDVPNILLSHNPNAFPRAAEAGIELTLSGHTHGGQVQVEILDHSFSPARFITDFTAGLYQLPFGLGAALNHEISSVPIDSQRAAAALYVNRGLGTVGAPIRIGVPPEITLITLKRS